MHATVKDARATTLDAEEVTVGIVGVLDLFKLLDELEPEDP